MPNSISIDGTKFIGLHKFSCGHQVPVYEVRSTNALNQIIGHAMFLNSQYGDVYYRGIDGIYDNVLPSLMRNRRKGCPSDLLDLLKKMCEDKSLSKSLKLIETIIPKSAKDFLLNKKIDRYNKFIAEGVLQHYAGATRFLDIVDNHWISLWMGMHKFIPIGKSLNHFRVEERQFDTGYILEQITNCKRLDVNIPYVYILLIVIPHFEKKPIRGIYESEDFALIDLRKALPSIYLRPHAQHALVVRRRDKNNIYQEASYYDLSNQISGLLQIRVDHAKRMLGEGTLLDVANFFPSPALDQGYNNLLMRENMFKNYFKIMRYY